MNNEVNGQPCYQNSEPKQEQLPKYLMAPECHRQKGKKRRFSEYSDVFTFGMLMWEVLYEQEPFEGDLSSTIEYVLKEDARPRIMTVELHNRDTATLRETTDIDA